jgi:hypothetical protein
VKESPIEIACLTCGVKPHEECCFGIESPGAAFHAARVFAFDEDINAPRCPVPVFVDDGWPAGACMRRAGHGGLHDVYSDREDG